MHGQKKFRKIERMKWKTSGKFIAESIRFAVAGFDELFFLSRECLG
jgi:hypothetical protein